MSERPSAEIDALDTNADRLQETPEFLRGYRGAMSEPRTPQMWGRVTDVVAQCLMCGGYLSLGTTQRDQRQARTWARHHAITNPGHRAVVDVTRTRSYVVSGADS